MLVRFSSLALCAFSLSMLGLQGCGDDSFNKRFDPKPAGDGDATGDLIPIQPGVTRSFRFTGNYKPTFSTGSGGLTENEQQRLGYLCLRVDSTKDTATPAYHDADETLIGTTAKINGGFSIPDVVVSEYGNTSPDASAIDASLRNLWLTKLAGPSRSHGFSNPSPKEYPTRQPPYPELSPAKLPFFDMRVVSTTPPWGGWDGSSQENCEQWMDEGRCGQHPPCAWVPASGGCIIPGTNFLKAFNLYFMTSMGCTFQTSDPKCRLDYQQSPTDCATKAEMSACFANVGCTWVSSGSGLSGECITTYSIGYMWRETITDGPTELVAQGAALHSISFVYDNIGVIRTVSEEIAPDENPTGAMPSRVETGRCIDGQPCVQGTWEDAAYDWSEAPCSF